MILHLNFGAENKQQTHKVGKDTKNKNYSKTWQTETRGLFSLQVTMTLVISIIIFSIITNNEEKKTIKKRNKEENGDEREVNVCTLTPNQIIPVPWLGSRSGDMVDTLSFPWLLYL